MVSAHPKLSRRYRTFVGYHLARRLVADILAGRIGEVLRSLKENRAAPPLRFSVRDLVHCYLAGSARRKALVCQLQQRPLLAASAAFNARSSVDASREGHGALARAA